MKDSVIKGIVVLFVLIQGAVCFFLIYLLNFFYSNPGVKPEIGLDKIPVLAIILFSFLISILFTVIIFNQIGKSKTEKLLPNQFVKAPSETKKKTDQDQKMTQVQYEKKRQMINELMKNLSASQSLENYTNQVLINISKQMDIFQGIFFVKNPIDRVYRKAGTYAYYTQEEIPEFIDGVGLTGQVAVNKKLLNIVNIPENYITVLSGLGKSSPTNLLIFPILFQDSCMGIVELASFVKFDTFIEQVLSEFSQIIGQHIAEISKPADTVNN